MATSTGNAVGTVKIVIGEVKVIGVDGVARIVHVGDKVFAHEVIVTSANAVVEVQLDNGNLLDLGRDSKIALDDDILNSGGGSTAAAHGAAAAAPGQDVAAIQAAIAAGQDPTKVAQATAAGGAAPAAGGGPESGGAHTPVIVDQANTGQAVTSGFSTAGAGIGFPTVESGPLLSTQQQPVISVSVNVAVDVETPPGQTPTPIDGSGLLGVGAADIIEGTDGGARTVNFVISLSQSFSSDVTVTYQILPGPGDAQHTAQTPSDYIPINGTTATVTIPAGTTTFTVPVQIVQDSTIENNENFSIVLTSATNATIDPNASSAVVTIIDDDLLANSDTNWAQEDTINAHGNVLQSLVHAGAPAGAFADVADQDTGSDTVGLSVSAVDGSGANVGHAVAGTYGSLILNADGTYTYTVNNADPAVQALAQGQQVTDTFSYTAVNGFGTTSTANLTVTIFGTDDAPAVTTGTSVTVSEEVLPAGNNDLSGADSDSSNDVLVAHGSFNISDVDSNAWTVALSSQNIQALTSGGQAIVWTGDGTSTLVGHVGSATGATIITIAVDNSGDVAGTNGSGTATYTVTLSGPLDQSSAGEDTLSFNVAASVNDGSGGVTPTSFTVNVEDDTPLAQPDTNQVTENGPLVATGNVIANDAVGADSHGTVSWTGNTTAQYGTVVLNTDGSYTYTLDNNNSTVQGLAHGQSITETFNYNLVDSDGDVSPSTLTITINGANDPPVITDFTNGGVTEDDTGDGIVPSTTNPDTDGLVLTTSGTVTFSDKDVTDTHTASATFVSSTYSGGQLGAIVGASNLSLTDTTNGTGGVVTWNYTLDDAKVDFLGASDHITETYQITVDDGNGGTATQDITITINGTNEAPVITLGEGDSATGSVTEDDTGNGIVPSTTNPDTDGLTLSTSGTLSFSDPDFSDSHTVKSVQFLNSTYGGGQLGGLVADVTTDTSSGTGGVVTWNYTLDDAKVDFLTAGQTITETYQITVDDGNGGTSTQDVTITINGTDEAPAVTEGTSVTVSEEVLPAGNNDLSGADSDSTNDTLVAHGSFNITDPDNNAWAVALSSQNIQALTSGGQAIVWTGDGTSTLVGHAGSSSGATIITIAVDNSGNVAGTNGSGTANYTVTLSGPLDQASAGEDTLSFNVAASVNDGSGGITPTSFTVNVEDDTPVAVNDSNSVTEDAVQNSVSGNVLTNDHVGADVTSTQAQEFAHWDTAANTAKYGTMVENSDGTYTYTLDNTNATVNALNVNQTLTETFTYTMKDADGDTSQATLTITINGANDAPQVTTGTSVTVSEEVLPAGNNDLSGADSDSTNDALVAHGSFNITDPDNSSWAVTLSTTGLPTNLTSGGNAIQWAIDNSGNLIGYITVSNVNTTIITIALDNSGIVTGSGGGTADYTVTLSGVLDHSSAGEDTLSFSVAANISDGSGGTASTSFGVTVEDDTPYVKSVVDGFIANDSVSLTQGSWINISYGADGPHQPQAVTSLTGTAPTGLHYLDATSDGSGGLTLIAEDSNNTQIYSLTVAADGHYTFDMLDPNPTTTSTASLTGLTGNAPVAVLPVQLASSLYALFSGDGNDDGNTSNDLQGAVDGIKSSTNGLGVGNDLLNTGETMYINFATTSLGGTPVEVFDTSFVVTNLTSGNHVDWVVYNNGILEASGEFLAPAKTNSGENVTIDLAATITSGSLANGFDNLVLTTPDASVKFVSMTTTEHLFTGDIALQFNVGFTDGDGDTTSTTLPITIVGTDATGYHFTGTSGADAIQGSTVSDTIDGGSGNDILTGGGGQDTFLYHSVSDGQDTITDFHIGSTGSDSNADILDIHDVLAGTAVSGSTDATALANYVMLDTTTSPGNTIVNVDPTGTGTFHPLVTLTGVTGETLSQLLSNNNIHT